MEENTERDEVYEQFMQDLQAKKKRQVKRTIREVIMVVIILGVIGFVVWFLTDPEASEKVSLRKEKAPVAYADIPFTTKDASSMEFAIAGKVMTFPCTMTDLYDAGYSMNESDAKIMLGQPASLMIDGYKSYETAICKMEARDFKGEFYEKNNIRVACGNDIFIFGVDLYVFGKFIVSKQERAKNTSTMRFYAVKKTPYGFS